MSDLLAANIATVQSDQQPTPATIPIGSGTVGVTIAPLTFLTKVTGTALITSISPPVTGSHLLAVITGTVDAAFTTSTTLGNIISAVTTGNTTNPILFYYDSATGKYLRIST